MSIYLYRVYRAIVAQYCPNNDFSFANDMRSLEVSHIIETRIKEPTFLDDGLLKDLIFCLYNRYVRDGGSVSTVETRIEEPTFIGDSLLKDLILPLQSIYYGWGKEV